MANVRKFSAAFGGGAYGDEGKGRIVDKFASDFSKKKQVIVYRDNGGANAGHTVEFVNGKRVSLHQLPSGVFVEKSLAIMGKGMVIHPQDLLEEITQVKEIAGKSLRSRLLIDEMAVLSLDTHRAFEAVLKEWEEGGRGATGRGISPAYADVLLRHPMRVRDLVPFNAEKLKRHYLLYEALMKGLGRKLSSITVPLLVADTKKQVGYLVTFMKALQQYSKDLSPYVQNVFEFLKEKWNDKNYAFIFEKGQGFGHDPRWGVYPDITASDTTFDGIFSSTEGVIDPDEIEVRAAVLKATYMSSVGVRTLPTGIENKLAEKIREDAHEYGATTGRPRGIALLDIPALKFFSKVGKANCLALTHMDIVYPNIPIKICVKYMRKGKEVEYRPDQEFLNTVKPEYIEMKSWDREAIQKARSEKELPKDAIKFLRFMEKAIGLPITMITTGPKRDQGIMLNSR